jgi:hypothetical protein
MLGDPLLNAHHVITQIRGIESIERNSIAGDMDPPSKLKCCLPKPINLS